MSDRLLFLLFDLSVKAALLAVLAELLLRALRVQVAAARHAAWTAVLGSLFVLAFLSPMSRGLSIPLLPESVVPAATAAPAVQVAVPPAHHSGSVAAAAVERLPESSRPPASAAAVQTSWSWKRWLILSYLLGACLMLSRLALGLSLSRRLVRNSRELTDPDLHSVCSRLCAIAGLRETPMLLASSLTRVPLAGGCWKPWIALPENWRSWSPSKLESVLAHELAHVRRGDSWTHLLVSVLRSLYWFHPAIWLVSSRISKLAEEACDNLAVSWTGSRIGYARHLLEVASALQGSPARIALAALPMAKRSAVGQRIEAIIREQPETSRTLTRKGPVIATLLTFALVAAAFHLELSAAASAAAAGNPPPAQSHDLSSPGPQVLAQATVAPHQAGTAASKDQAGDHAAARGSEEGAGQPENIQRLVSEAVSEAKANQRRAATAATPARPEETAARIRAISSSDAETRARAAFELWRSGTKAPEAVPPLVSLLGDRAKVRAFVDDNEQLIKLRSITALKTDPGREAVRALGSLGEPAVDALAVALGSGNAEVRQDATTALGGTFSRRAVQPLIHALADPEPEVRRMAAWGLGSIEDPSALAGVTRLLQDKDEGVRTMAAWAQLKLKLKQAEAGPESSAQASFEELQADLRHQDYRIRRAAAEGLERLADPRAVPALATAVRDSYYGVRIAAAGALGQIGGAAAEAALHTALGDDDYRVRLRAAAELSRHGNREALAALEKSLRHEHQAVRAEAAQDLGLTRNPAAVDPLISVLKDQHPRVRRMAAWALGNIGDARAVPALDAALKDKDQPEEVRDAVRSALDQLKNGAGSR
jgi:HEAT repeat protein/beta-lactamase regulating signal transducer with metallopeptidase domain